jgi:hypothetical protein
MNKILRYISEIATAADVPLESPVLQALVRAQELSCVYHICFLLCHMVQNVDLPNVGISY